MRLFSLLLPLLLLLPPTSALLSTPSDPLPSPPSPPPPPPPPQDLHPHLFNVLNSLLRQHPSTFHPNSTSIIPATLAPGIPLYHARPSSNPPPSPEWLALSPQMSTGIMSTRPGRVWMNTYTPVRPLKLLLFNGLSAALGPGWLDAQHLLLYNSTNVTHGGRKEEFRRARELCAWAAREGLPLDGFVRTNAGIEVLLCDFTTGALRLLSRREITAPHPPTELPETWEDSHGILHWNPSPGGEVAAWEWARSALTRDRGWGRDNRISLDTCRVFDYGPRTSAVTASQAANLRTQLEDVLRAGQKSGECSGVDWSEIVAEIVGRYHGLLRGHSEDVAESVRLLFRPDDGHQLHRCTTEFTGHLPTLSPQETKLKAAVEGVLGRICRLFLTDGWKDRDRVDSLRAWLGWAEDWASSCAGSCAPSEICMMGPVWPVLGPQRLEGEVERGGRFDGEYWTVAKGRWMECIGIEVFQSEREEKEMVDGVQEGVQKQVEVKYSDSVWYPSHSSALDRKKDAGQVELLIQEKEKEKEKEEVLDLEETVAQDNLDAHEKKELEKADALEKPAEGKYSATGSSPSDSLLFQVAPRDQAVSPAPAKETKVEHNHLVVSSIENQTEPEEQFIRKTTVIPLPTRVSKLAQPSYPALLSSPSTSTSTPSPQPLWAKSCVQAYNKLNTPKQKEGEAETASVALLVEAIPSKASLDESKEQKGEISADSSILQTTSTSIPVEEKVVPEVAQQYSNPVNSFVVQVAPALEKVGIEGKKEVLMEQRYSANPQTSVYFPPAAADECSRALYGLKASGGSEL